MRLADRPPKAVPGLWHGDPMSVIGHPAIGPDHCTLFAASVGHQSHMGRLIAVVEERLLAAVPALRHVMRQTGDDQPRQSCHARRLWDITYFVNTSIVSPSPPFPVPIPIPSQNNRNTGGRSNSYSSSGADNG